MKLSEKGEKKRVSRRTGPYRTARGRGLIYRASGRSRALAPPPGANLARKQACKPQRKAKPQRRRRPAGITSSFAGPPSRPRARGWTRLATSTRCSPGSGARRRKLFRSALRPAVAGPPHDSDANPDSSRGTST